MKPINIIFSILFFAFFSSCQKGVDFDLIATTPTTTTDVRVKSYTEEIVASGVTSTTTYDLTYDSQGRILSMISASNPGDKFVYQYNSNTSYTTDLFNSNIQSVHQVSFINSLLLVDSTFQYNDTNDTLTEKYLYNSAKQLTQLKQYDYKKLTGAVLFDTYNYEYDTKGNVKKESSSIYVKTFEYYPTLLNNLSLGYVYFTASKNLVKTTTYTSGGSVEVLNHAYTFDASNRLSTEKITLTGSSDVVTRTYTY